MMLVRRDSEEVCRGVPTCFVRCIVFADFSIATGHGKDSMPAARYFNYCKLYRNSTYISKGSVDAWSESSLIPIDEYMERIVLCISTNGMSCETVRTAFTHTGSRLVGTRISLSDWRQSEMSTEIPRTASITHRVRKYYFSPNVGWD